MKVLAISLILISSQTAFSTPTPIDKQDIYRSDISVSNSDPKQFRSAAIQSIRHAIKEDYERIVIDFSENFAKGGDYSTPLSESPKVEKPPRYTAKYTQNPYAIIIDYNTRRGIGTLPDFGKSKLIKHIYRIPTFDDGGQSIAIIFKQAIKAEIFELHQPGRLVIDVKADTTIDAPIYVVRTKSTDKMGTINEHTAKDWKTSAHIEGWPPELRKQLIVEKRAGNAEPTAQPKPWKKN